MASALPSFASTKETTNYARLCRLLVDVGSQALRDTFDSIHPPAGLHHVLARHPEHAKLQALHTGRRRVINPTQWGNLYPTIPSSVSSAGFDITLLMILLRNICGLHPPATGWDNLPPPADTTKEANIARVKYYRNTVYGHASQASVDDATFNTYWQDTSTALVALGGVSYGAAINKLKNECMDPDTEEHYIELLKKWKKDEDIIKDKLEEIEGNIKDKLREVEELLKECKEGKCSIEDKLGEVEDKMRNDIEQLSEKLDTFMAQREGSSSKDKDETRDDLKQMKSEIQNISEKLNSKMSQREGMTDEENNRSNLEWMKVEIGNMQDKLDSLMNQLPPVRKKPPIEDKIRNDIEQLNEKLDTFMAEREGSSSKDEDETRDDLKQMKSEIQNISEKLNSLKLQGGETTDEENTGSNLELLKVEIGNMNEKLETLMKQLPSVKEKPRIEDDSDPAELIDGIRQLYKLREGWLAPFPWCEEFHFHLDNIYTRLKVISRKKERGTATANTVDMSGIFKPHEESSHPRTVLIEGTPGMGKTTYCKKLVYDWATGNQEAEDGFPRFDIVLLLRCRDMKSDIWEAIDDQLLPRDVNENVRERFFNFIRHNQSNVLLILDGLDEVPANKLPMFSEIIQGRVLPRCRLVATARHEAGIKVRIHCDTLLEIEGFTEEDGRNFIVKYFKTREDLAEKLLHKLQFDAKLNTLARNPLNTALFCLVCEDQGTFPENRTQLFLEMIQCVLRRYRKKEGLSDTEDDLIEVYKSELKHLGRIALEGLRKDSLDFDESELANHLNILRGSGFLSVQLGGSKLRPSRRYSFLHKSFQEWFAVFYLCCQLVEGKISPDELLSKLLVVIHVDDFGDDYWDEVLNGFVNDDLDEDNGYSSLCFPCYSIKENVREVLCFAINILAARCEELAVALIQSMVARDEVSFYRFLLDAKSWSFHAIECIKEFKRDNSKCFIKLASAFGSSLKFKGLNFSTMSSDDIAVLAEVFKVNTTVDSIYIWSNENYFHQERDYSFLDDWTVIANALKHNSTLTAFKMFDLTFYVFGKVRNYVAYLLAELLKLDTTLKELTVFVTLRDVEILVRYLAEGLEVNKTLTTLHLLNYSPILEYNFHDCQYLENNIRTGLYSPLAEALGVNKTLTKLDLSYTGLGNSGAAFLADALKRNTGLLELHLYGNGILDEGAACFADALRVNKALTTLNLKGNGISNSGAACLADALKVNTTLKEFILIDNGIGDKSTARFSQVLRVNQTLATLGLSNHRISNSGAACLADALKVNTTLTELSVPHTSIGDQGAACLANVLKSNTALIELNLSGNRIRDEGAARFGEALRVNKTLKKLNLAQSDIGDSGAACLADALKSNTDLIELNLSHSNIAIDGISSLVDTLQHKTTLKLCLSWSAYLNLIDDSRLKVELWRLKCAGRVELWP